MEIDEEGQQGAARQGAAGGAGQGGAGGRAAKKEAGEKLKEPSVNLTSQAGKFQLQPARKNPVAYAPPTFPVFPCFLSEVFVQGGVLPSCVANASHQPSQPSLFEGLSM
jgi:hypothetical protein